MRSAGRDVEQPDERRHRPARGQPRAAARGRLQCLRVRSPRRDRCLGVPDRSTAGVTHTASGERGADVRSYGRCSAAWTVGRVSNSGSSPRDAQRPVDRRAAGGDEHEVSVLDTGPPVQLEQQAQGGGAEQGDAAEVDQEDVDAGISASSRSSAARSRTVASASRSPRTRTSRCAAPPPRSRWPAAGRGRRRAGSLGTSDGATARRAVSPTWYRRITSSRKVRPLPGAAGSGCRAPPVGSRVPSKNIVLDADVVVEPLQVPQVGDGGRGVDVQVRGAVPGDLQVVRGGDGGDPEPLGDAAAAGGVGLQAVDGARGAHALEVGEVAAVLAGGDVGGHGVAHPAQPVEVVGGDRLLEPADVAVGDRLQDPDRLLGGVAAVGVDEQLDLAGRRRCGPGRSGRGRVRAGCPTTRRS